MYKLWSTLHTAVVVAAVFLFLVFILLPFAGCDTDFDVGAEKDAPSIAVLQNFTERQIDSLVPTNDSVRLHAFDKLFFGHKTDVFSQKFSVDNIGYDVICSKEVPDGRVYSFLLVSDTKVHSAETARLVLEQLKDIIKAKHSNYDILNQHYYVKDPNDQTMDEACFSMREKLKHNENAVGRSYEYAGYSWDLKYKEIQIGYFIEHEDNASLLSDHDSNSYVIYIQFTSKVLENLLPLNHNPDSRRNIDAQKF
ncbi:hypothetical protein [uncultured Flavobacterium sp.]|uniref:hypothetical protein n=1 Tax=uncultured Flavobacterium sp. TaxID=165435 RepID=UPI0025E18830|nr:hypothetical protein [uncultured Flavobacterium sp.]